MAARTNESAENKTWRYGLMNVIAQPFEVVRKEAIEDGQAIWEIETPDCELTLNQIRLAIKNGPVGEMISFFGPKENFYVRATIHSHNPEFFTLVYLGKHQ